MKIIKGNFDNHKGMLLDENDELKEVNTLEYDIIFQNEEEYESIKDVIFESYTQGIEVYQIVSNFDRLIIDSNKMIAIHDVILILTTNDETKFEELKIIVTNIANRHSDTLH